MASESLKESEGNSAEKLAVPCFILPGLLEGKREGSRLYNDDLLCSVARYNIFSLFFWCGKAQRNYSKKVSSLFALGKDESVKEF